MSAYLNLSKEDTITSEHSLSSATWGQAQNSVTIGSLEPYARVRYLAIMPFLIACHLIGPWVFQV